MEAIARDALERSCSDNLALHRRVACIRSAGGREKEKEGRTPFRGKVQTPGSHPRSGTSSQRGPSEAVGAFHLSLSPPRAYKSAL